MMKKVFIVFVLLLIVSCRSTETSKKELAKGRYDNIEESDLLNNQKNKLIVAILLPLSGSSEKIGNSMLKAAQLSMFDNKLNNIVLMPYDTKGSSFGAIDAINSAIRDGANIIIGPFTYTATKAIVDIANINNLIVLSLSDNQNLITSKYSNIYLMGLTPKQEIYRIISYLIDYQNFYGFSGIFPNDAYGNITLKDFKEVIFRKDAKIVKTDFYSRNDLKLEKRVDNLLNSNIFREEVYKKYEEEKALAKVEGLKSEVEFKYTEEDKIYANALLLPDSGNDLIKIGEYVSAYKGRHKPLLIGTSRWLNTQLYSLNDFDGSMFVSPNPNNYVNFNEKYYIAYQSYPLRIASLAYDAVTAVMESYAKAGDKENIKFALENYQGFEGINGKFRFLSDGFLERRLAIIKITKGRFEIVDYDDEPFLKY